MFLSSEYKDILYHDAVDLPYIQQAADTEYPVSEYVLAYIFTGLGCGGEKNLGLAKDFAVLAKTMQRTDSCVLKQKNKYDRNRNCRRGSGHIRKQIEIQWLSLQTGEGKKPNRQDRLNVRQRKKQRCFSGNTQGRRTDRNPGIFLPADPDDLKNQDHP